MSDPTKPKPARQLYAEPMRKYTVFLDKLTAEYYKARGKNENRSEGMRTVAREAMETSPLPGSTVL